MAANKPGGSEDPKDPKNTEKVEKIEKSVSEKSSASKAESAAEAKPAGERAADAKPAEGKAADDKVIGDTATKADKPEAAVAEPEKKADREKAEPKADKEAEKARRKEAKREAKSQKKIADAQRRLDAATASAAAGDSAEVRESKAAAKPGRRKLIGGLSIAAAIIGVALLIAAFVLHTKPGVDFDNEAFVDDEDTTAVATAAAANAKQLVSVDYETLDQYKAAIPDIVTPNLETELDKSWDQLADTYKQSKTKVTAEVQNAGVSYLQGDRAEVLVVENVSVTQDGKDAGETVGTYLLQLQNVDGTWKLSSIPDLPS
ncbi:hypothetical protein [Dietzia sp.]|uniref:hypothetical protein n=1 Tax=Dietzia sp. TaxID=1871616 RepID=UPI002FDB5548